MTVLKEKISKSPIPFLSGFIRLKKGMPGQCKGGESITNWALKNSVAISAVLEEASNIIRERKQNISNDPQARMLSEMPLCSSLNCIYGKIKGFEYIDSLHGSLLLDVGCNPLNLYPVRIAHGFAFNYETNEIVDFAFGQAVNTNSEGTLRGDSINLLKTAIPEMITIIDSEKGVAMLHGQRDKIYQETGFYYKDC